MTKTEVMKELESFGNAQTKKTFLKHGAQEPIFGVRVGDMKKIVKKIKKNHILSLELYDTGNADAMYLAGLIADEEKITEEDLHRWAEAAEWYMISEYTVAWVAADSPYGQELGLRWIDSDIPHVAAAGWSTLASVLTVQSDENIDFDKYEGLLDRVGEQLHQSPNRVRYAMNNFVISVGGYVESLSEKAIEIAEKVGKVHVNVGDTACKVPEAPAYIKKMHARKMFGKKRKTARC
jgi:3-methyladenine DNA glycosylase AlkD